MEKIRCGKTVYMRTDDTQEWTNKKFDSINLAKKFNGLDSKTVQIFKMLPARREVQA